MRFSETGAAFLADMFSKHAMHANCTPEVLMAGAAWQGAGKGGRGEGFGAGAQRRHCTENMWVTCVEHRGRDEKELRYLPLLADAGLTCSNRHGAPCTPCVCHQAGCPEAPLMSHSCAWLLHVLTHQASSSCAPTPRRRAATVWWWTITAGPTRPLLPCCRAW
jgi:hypothetical protein